MAGRLSGLDNTKETGNVQPYSSFVKWVKVILPLMVLAILGLLILWPQLSEVETVPLTEKDLSALKEAQTENKLVNPVFNTLDSEGKPFSITAKEARQNRNDSERVYLSNPFAEMKDTDNQFELEASEGEYDQKQKILILNNNVKVKDAQNNILETNTLKTSISEGKAESSTPAKLTTDQGVIEGQRVIIDHQNQTTTFQGPAKAVINQK